MIDNRLLAKIFCFLYNYFKINFKITNMKSMTQCPDCKAKVPAIDGPTHAYFGQKDIQQVKIIEKMVEDLNFPINIVSLSIEAPIFMIPFFLRFLTLLTHRPWKHS
jgi:hypothetical protein